MIANENKNILQQLIPDNFSRYTRTVNADQDILSIINTFQSDPNFKILKITANTHQEVESFIQSENFCEAFNRASHWFVIAVQIEIERDSPPEHPLLSQLNNRKPVILQWHSPSTKKLYYRNSGDDDFIDFDLQPLHTSSPEKPIEDLITEEPFTFQILLQALKANLGGQLNDNLLTATLNIAREFDSWRLIDYATRYKDSLSLRWLLLSVTNEDLTKKNGCEERTLEIAAEHATPECLLALLNLPFSATGTEEWFLSSSSRNLLELKNAEGNTPFLIAAKHRNVDNVDFLVRCGSDINYKNANTNQRAIDIAWQEKSYDVVLILLQADSPFPRGFQKQYINDSRLKEFVLERCAFHQALKDRKSNEIEAFIQKYPRLKHAYNTENYSALTSTLNTEQYNIYAFLQSKGYAVGREEKQYPEELLTEEQKQKLKKAKECYFGKSEHSHIIYLLSKSRLGLGQTDNQAFDKIKNLYETLDNISEISTILKVVEQIESLEIIFDFNHDSIINIDPTQSATTAGACDYRRGRIYIGGKQENDADLLGTLAHELCHLAMQMRYNNDCNPYEILEETKEASFEKIIQEYQDNTSVDNIIKRVFSVYPHPNDWPSELIVRVPHLLAKYSNEQILQQQASSLLTWYRNQIPADLTSFITNPKFYKAQNKIQDLNQQFEQLDALKERSTLIQLTDKRLLSDAEIDGKQMTILSTSSPQFTLLNLYQQLANRLTPNQLIRNLLVVQPVDIKKYLISISDALYGNPDLLLIVDNIKASNEAGQKDFLSVLRYIKAQIQKVLLIVPIDTTIQQWKEFSPRQIADSAYSWQDLTKESQPYILEKEVNFQGYQVELKQIINPNTLDDLINEHSKDIIDSDTLYELITDQEVKIGKELPISSGYNKDYYIDRKFNYQVELDMKKIQEEKNNQSFLDLLSYTEEDFNRLCLQYPQSNVHWLKAESRKLTWQKSKGSIFNIVKYRVKNKNNDDNKNATSYLENDLLTQTDQKVVIISDTAGMGKTTVLTSLSKQIKESSPSLWVVRIDLNDYSNELEERLSNSGFNDVSEAVDFLSSKLLKLSTPLAQELFKLLCKVNDKIEILFDGFDEISPDYKDVILNLVQKLRTSAIKRVLITTRPYMQAELEEKLGVFAYTLEPFSIENQIDFLTKFWQKQNQELTNKNKLAFYAEQLIKRLNNSINDKEKEFTGIPLQVRMVAEVFENKQEIPTLLKKILQKRGEKIEPIEEGIKEFHDSKSMEPNFPEFSLSSLYKHFIYKKYCIYEQEKNKSDLSKIGVQRGMQKLYPNFIEDHQKLALYALFTEKEQTILLSQKEVNSVENLIDDIKTGKEKTGIIDQVIEGKPHFIHRTFTEYFTADFLVNMLNKNEQDKNKQELLLRDILLKPDYQVVRSFLDSWLKNKLQTLPKKTLKQYGDIIKNSLDPLVRDSNPLHIAAREGNANIVVFLLNGFKEYSNDPNSVKDFIKTMDQRGDNALHEAVSSGSVEVITLLLAYFEGYNKALKEVIKTTGNNGETTLYRAIYSGNVEIITLLLAPFEGDNRELKNFIITKTYDRNTVLHRAVSTGSVEFITTLLQAFKGDTNKEALKKIIIIKNQDGDNALHLAVSYGKVEVITALLKPFEDDKNKEALKEIITNEEMNRFTALDLAAIKGLDQVITALLKPFKDDKKALKEVIITKRKYKNTALHQAAYRDNIKVITALLKPLDDDTKSLKEIITTKGINGGTALHHAAYDGNIEIITALLKSFKDDNEALKDFIITKDNNGATAVHQAAYSSNIEFITALLTPFKDDTKTLKEVITTKGKFGGTALHRAAYSGNVEVITALLKPFKDDQKALKEVITTKDKFGGTALHRAAYNGNVEVITALLKPFKDDQKALKEVITTKERKGYTALHRAAFSSNIEVITALLKPFKDDHKTLKEVITTKGKFGGTALHRAAYNGNVEVITALLKPFKDDQKALKEFIITKGKDGDTALHRALTKCHYNVAETLLSYAKNMNDNWITFRELILSPDNTGNTPFKVVKDKDKLEEILKKFIKQVSSENPPPDEIVKLLQSITNTNCSSQASENEQSFQEERETIGLSPPQGLARAPSKPDINLLNSGSSVSDCAGR